VSCRYLAAGYLVRANDPVDLYTVGSGRVSDHTKTDNPAGGAGKRQSSYFLYFVIQLKGQFVVSGCCACIGYSALDADHLSGSGSGWEDFQVIDRKNRAGDRCQYGVCA